MELIKEIYEKDLHIKQDTTQNIRYKLRRAARALVFQGDKIAVLNAGKLHLHKLPGGGLEDNESKFTGLSREILEETGCKIVNTREVGITIEYRDAIEMAQISYVFICDIADVGAPDFTKKELDEGFKLVWFTVREAIALMKNKDQPDTYAGKFIHVRDLAILDYFLRQK